jgi:hypothetical protein
MGPILVLAIIETWAILGHAEVPETMKRKHPALPIENVSNFFSFTNIQPFSVSS